MEAQDRQKEAEEAAKEEARLEELERQEYMKACLENFEKVRDLF